MLSTHYVGLDIHKKTISFCVRQSDGVILLECTIAGNSQAFRRMASSGTSALGSRHGSDDVYGLGLRPLAASLAAGEGGSSSNAESDLGR